MRPRSIEYEMVLFRRDNLNAILDLFSPELAVAVVKRERVFARQVAGHSAPLGNKLCRQTKEGPYHFATAMFNREVDIATAHTEEPL